MVEQLLVGRERELVDVERAVLGAGAGVVLLGERGVGKTGLWDGFLTPAAGRRAVCRVVATMASQSIPFGAVASLLPELPSAPLQDIQLLSMALHAIRDRVPGERLLLGVDDVHLLDDASATVVDQLVATGDVVLVATQASETPMAAWLDGHVRLGRVRSHELRPLERAAQAALVCAVVGGEVDDTVEAELWRLSAGNPLVVRQLVVAALESGVLVKQGSIWHAASAFVATGQLGELLDARLAGRDAAELAVLELAATAGAVELALLEAIGGRETVEALEAAELLSVESDDGRLRGRLTHPLLAERMVQSMPVTRRRRISRALAEWVVSAGARRRSDTLRVATWQLQGGLSPQPQVAVRAATQALGGFDPDLARRLCRSALDAGAGFEAQLTLGRALFELGEIDEADEVLRAAQAVAADDSEAARSAIARCELLTSGRLDLAAAIDVATQVATTIAAPDWLDSLHAELARLALEAGDPDQAIRIGRQISARDTASRRALLAGLVVSAPANVMLGDFGAAASDARRAVALVDGVPDCPPLTRDRLLMTRAEALVYAGEIGEAAAVADSGLRSGRDSLSPTTAGLWQASLGFVTLWAGDVTASRRLYDQSIAALTRHDPFVRVPRVRAFAALAAAQAGNLGAIERALAGIDLESLEADYQTDVLVQRAEAWTVALRGDTEAATRRALKAALAAIDHHHFVMAAIALHDGVRFGHPDVVARDLRDLVAQVEGSLLPALADHGEALAERGGAALDAVSHTYAVLGANLLAAEAATQASALHRCGRDSRAAVRSQTRADALLGLCPGADTPALCGGAAGLTMRQRQVAQLAPHHTNAEIASRLHISVRTVESHLVAVYDKFGVHRRSELADILGREPTPDS